MKSIKSLSRVCSLIAFAACTQYYVRAAAAAAVDNAAVALEPPFDVMFLVDDTKTMNPHIDALRWYLPLALKQVEVQLPGTRWGWSSFNDKPGAFLSNIADSDHNYCNALNAPLGSDLHSILHELTEAWWRSFSIYHGPKDPEGAPRDPLGALVAQTGNDDAGGWREDKQKIAVVVTDGAFRYAGDNFASAAELKLPANNGDSAYDCSGEQHYTEQQVSTHLIDKNIYPLFVVNATHAALYDNFLSQHQLNGTVKPFQNFAEVTSLILEGLLELGRVADLPKPTLWPPARDCGGESDVQLDLMFALDNSYGMAPYNERVYLDLPLAVDYLREQVADLRVAVSTFNDQPYEFSGYTGSITQQYCDTLEAPFDSHWGATLSAAHWAYHYAADFKDKSLRKEDSLGAMAHQSANKNAGWRTEASDDKYVLKKVMFVVTHGTFRLPDDGLSTDAGNKLPPNDGDADYRCGRENFYSKEQAAKLIKHSGVHLVVLTLADVADNYTDFFETYGVDGQVISIKNADDLQAGIKDYLLQAVGHLSCFPTVPPTLLPSPPEPCLADHTFDIALAVDNSASMAGYTNLLWDYIFPALERIKASVPGTRSGLISFNDKRSDLCPACYCNGGNVTLDDPREKFYRIAGRYEELIKDNAYPDKGSAGVDSLGVMAYQVYSNRWIRWRDGDSTPNLHKLLIVFTDQIYKLPNDDTGPTRQPNDGENDYDCFHEQYFSIEQTKSALEANADVTVLVVTSQDRSYRALFKGMEVPGRTLSFNDIAQLPDYIMEIFNLCPLPPLPTTAEPTATEPPPTVDQSSSESPSSSPPPETEAPYANSVGKPSGSATGLIVGATAGGVAVLGAVIGGSVAYHRRRSAASPEVAGETDDSGLEGGDNQIDGSVFEEVHTP